MGIKNKVQKLKVTIPAVFIAMKRKETPFIARLLASIVVLYALSPIDLIPDFIPVIGLLDDVILIPLFIALVIKLIPTDLWNEFQEEAQNLWDNGIPKKWFFAIPIVTIWIIVIYLVLHIFI